MTKTNAERDRQKLATALKTNFTSGLSAEQVKQRQTDGRNVLQEEKPPTIFQKKFGGICLTLRHWCCYLRWRYQLTWRLPQMVAGRRLS